MLLLLGGIVLTWLGANEVHRTLVVNRAKTHVTAKVTETAVNSSTKGATTHDVHYRFDVDGKTYSFTDATGRKGLWASVNVDEWHQADETKRIDVVYDKDDPWINRPASSDKQPILDASAGLLFGIALLLTGAWMLVTANRTPRSTDTDGGAVQLDPGHSG